MKRRRACRTRHTALRGVCRKRYGVMVAARLRVTNFRQCRWRMGSAHLLPQTILKRRTRGKMINVLARGKATQKNLWAFLWFLFNGSRRDDH